MKKAATDRRHSITAPSVRGARTAGLVALLLLAITGLGTLA